MKSLIRNKYVISLIIVICLSGIGYLNNANLRDSFSEKSLWWFLGMVNLYLVWICYEWFSNVLNKNGTRLVYNFLAILSSLGIGSIILSIIIAMFKHEVSPQELGGGEFILYAKLCLASSLLIFIQFSISTIDKTKQMKIKNISLEHENLEVKYKLLIDQINPHFLFNSLSTLRSMVRSKDPKSEEFVLKLSDVYREFLKKKEDGITTLKEELKFIETYFFMLETRFEGMLKMNVDVSELLLEHQIPVFSLVVLLENSVKHNVISSQNPLVICIYDEADKIVVSNFIHPKKNVESMGTGLRNLRKRYSLLGYSDGVEVCMNDRSFTVKLKLFS